jgi:hypothetical protein
MNIHVAVPEAEVSKPILDASLESLTRLNQSMLKKGKIPTFRSAVNNVRWKPEPPGAERFDHGGIVLGRGWGDCDDLAGWHAASLRESGEDRGATAIVNRSGDKRWHAVVKRSDGSIDDPSKEAGMRRGIAPGILAPRLDVIRPTSAEVGAYMSLPRLAVRPIRTNPASSEIEAWQARADLPWNWSPGNSPTDIAMASLHASPVASQSVVGLENAIVGALAGALEMAEASGFVDGDTMAVGEAMTWVCGGADYEVVCGEFGEDVADLAFDQVDGLFRQIGKGIKKISSGVVKAVTSKAGRGLLSMIPGVGPVAATALDMAGPSLRKMADSGKRHPKGSKVTAVRRRIVKHGSSAPRLPKRGVRKAIVYFPPA